MTVAAEVVVRELKTDRKGEQEAGGSGIVEATGQDFEKVLVALGAKKTRKE